MVLKWRSFVCILLIVILIWLAFQFEILNQCFSDSSLVTKVCSDEKLSHALQRLFALQAAFERRYKGIDSHQGMYQYKGIDSHQGMYQYKEIDSHQENLAFISQLPTIYAITPTYTRYLQKAELTRQIHTFLHVPKFHWIVVEDSESRTSLVSNLLIKSGLLYTHLNVASPEEYKLKSTDPHWTKSRGILQRNLGLEWIRKHLNEYDKGVVYFADDDNTYDLELFYEMRDTKKVSVWPVGLVGGLIVERPKVSNGHVVGWLNSWGLKRKFAIDMAGFAINVQLLLEHPQVKFSLKVLKGFQESLFLEKLVTVEDLEPMAGNCTKVLVWHTRSEKPNLKQELKLLKLNISSYKNIEV